MDVPLENSQVALLQNNIYKILKIGRPLPPIISFDYLAFAINLPFIDPPRPKIVDYSLTKLS